MSEPLSKRSKIITADDTAAIEIAPSQLSFSDFYTIKLQSTTPPNDHTRSFTFNMLPTMSSELHPASCDVVVKWKIKKLDGGVMPSTAQVGVMQAFAVTSWSRCSVKIAGNVYKNEFSFADHATFIKLMTGYTEAERKSILHPIGFREDAIGRADSTKVEVDPVCTCDCL